jgi:hypothetical protein
MGQCKIEHRDFKNYAYSVFRHGCCKSEHRGFKKAKERWDIASLGTKDFKRD